MKSIIAALITFNIISTAYAADIVEATVPPKSPNPTQTQPPPFAPPSEEALPDNAYGRLVQRGRAIFVDTQANASEFVGNGLNCTNCHLEQGRKADSAPLWGAYTMYPAYRKKNDKVNTVVVN